MAIIEAELISQIDINMKLSTQEARILRAMMQNAVSPDENPVETALRRSIFEALTKATGAVG